MKLFIIHILIRYWSNQLVKADNAKDLLCKYTDFDRGEDYIYSIGVNSVRIGKILKRIKRIQSFLK